jgi:hypothetical protein
MTFCEEFQKVNFSPEKNLKFYDTLIESQNECFTGCLGMNMRVSFAIVLLSRGYRVKMTQDCLNWFLASIALMTSFSTWPLGTNGMKNSLFKLFNATEILYTENHEM